MTELQLTLSPEQSADNQFIKKQIAKNLDIETNDISEFKIIRKSIDARGRIPLVIMQLRVFINENTDKHIYQEPFNYRNVSNKKEVIIIGAGPAGLFAALRLIELGFCPIIVERGKNVKERKVDVANISKNKELNEESNLCFGEGGAGTFSDGKLYSRSNKRGNTNRIIEIFHYHGAKDEILYEAHPHIGTDILSVVVTNIRKTILECGGQILFSAKVTDILIENGKAKGVRLADNRVLKSDFVILATGHSSRDIYRLLQEKNIAIQAKGFAPEEPAKRTVEVEAFCSWSACKIKILSNARTNTGFGLYSSHGVANIMCIKFAV